MNVENRQEYIDVLVSLLKPGGKILLTTWEYERSLHSGPPFSMDGEDVRQSFESVFEIEHLQATDLQQDHFFCKVHPCLPWAKQHAFCSPKEFNPIEKFLRLETSMQTLHVQLSMGMRAMRIRRKTWGISRVR